MMEDSYEQISEQRRRVTQEDNGPVILASCIASLRWRLEESLSRINEAQVALVRGDGAHAVQRLTAVEPLLFDADHLVTVSLILVRESRAEKSSS